MSLASWQKIALGAIMAAAILALAPGTAGAQDEIDGRDVYLANCAGCHQSDGLGVPGTFPPLSGNPNVQDTEYVRTVIIEGLSGPIEVLGETYDGVMPPFGHLSPAEIDAVIAFVQADEFDAEGSGALEPGDVARGEKLFLGSDRLENGGPACASCHTVFEYQALNGPTLGPDLSDLAVRYGGEDSVVAALANPPSATMQPLFVDRPITDQERADLGAYLSSGSEAKSSGFPIDILLVGGLLGGVALFALMLLAPRSRRPGFARQLRSQP